MQIGAMAVAVCLVSACGSASRSGPYLSTKVVGERWYASPARCAQGPFDIQVPALGGRWGESVEVMIGAPRRVRMTVEIVQGSETVEQTTLTVGPAGTSNDEPDNDRCVADALEIDASMSGGAGGSSGPGTGPGDDVAVGPGDDVAVRPGPGRGAQGGGVALDVRTGKRPGQSPTTALGASWWNDDPDRPAPLAAGGSIRVRLWSSVPNDLDGVYFLVVQSVRKPNVDDEAYIAHVRAERQREEERIRQEMERRRQEMERERRRAASAPPPAVPTSVDQAELERRRRQAVAKAEREEQRRQEEARRERERERRKEEARRRREAYCEANRDDTGCWGPGGFTVNADLERRKKERAAWCSAHPEEARCWSTRDWSVRRSYWHKRQLQARLDAQGPPEPTGPPPLPRDEVQPPRPSDNAEWRPGYWHWDGSVWHWLAGMWRVPEADIVEERTVKAPSEAPPPRTESAPPPPAPHAVWIAGHWQWDGSAWVWVAGSWQLPPDPLMEWKPPTWVPRGDVRVFVPGGWIKVRAR